MEKVSLKNQDIKFPEKAYDLLSWTSKGIDLTLRDDRYDFPWLLDIVKACRRRRRRIRLVDSGKLDVFQMEWLSETGADIYTSDKVRPGLDELALVCKAGQKGRAITAYFHHGPLEHMEGEAKDNEVTDISGLLELGRNGIYIYLSNKEKERNPSYLNDLAYACRKGNSWLVYYHHGPPDPFFKELAFNGAWIHVSHESVREPQDTAILFDTF